MQHRGRLIRTGALLACLLTAGPAANAAFSSSTARQAMGVSAHVMAAPAGNTVSTSCTAIGNSGKYRLNITVTNHGNVPKATNYILRVADPSGVTQVTRDLTPGATYDSGPSTGVVAGVWKYSIDAQYRVPGTTNIWTSKAPQVSVVC